MALSLSSTTAFACSQLYDNNSGLQFTSLSSHKRNPNAVNVKCESTESELPANAKKSKLAIGSPVIVVEAPRMIKTAASVPCLRVNSGLVKPGDVGRIVSRKPKDVWAVRLTIGTYLIDGKYFKPLELDP
ncbi:protein CHLORORESPIRATORY REDUCTION 42, chloroplastic [Rosa sericea]